MPSNKPLPEMFDPARHLALVLHIKTATTFEGEFAIRVGQHLRDMKYTLPPRLPASELISQLAALGYQQTNRQDSAAIARRWGTGDGIPTATITITYNRAGIFAVPCTAQTILSTGRPVIALLPALVPTPVGANQGALRRVSAHPDHDPQPARPLLPAPAIDPAARIWHRSPNHPAQTVKLVETLPGGNARIAIPGMLIPATVPASTLSPVVQR